LLVFVFPPPVSPRSKGIQKKDDEEYEQTCAEDEEETVELVVMESSSEDEEQLGEPSLVKRVKYLHGIHEFLHQRSPVVMQSTGIDFTTLQV
jgi:hypothetical protein